MAVYKYVALSCAVAGREAEYDAWYNGRHINDVAAVPGVKSASRYKIISSQAEDGGPPNWRSLAIYEIETNGDPEDIVAGIRARHGTDLMPATDTLDRAGMVQIIAELAATGEKR